MIHAITPKLFHYAWGSTTSIPDMLGMEATDLPVAEAWLGDVARVVGADGTSMTLADLIADDPTSALGHARLDELPYLVKLLAAQSPLSIQVHPTATAARVGYDRECSLGIPETHPTRIFRDRNPKPEAILALEHFELLAGFRDPAETAKLIRALPVPALERTAALLSANGAAAIRNAVTELCALEVEVVSAIIDGIVAASTGAFPVEHAAVVRRVTDLAASYPADIGVVLALLMNHVVLERFDLAFIDVGVVHTYLGGLGLEVMGNSDNVIRGGLTVKHVDVTELLHQLDFEPGLPLVVRQSERPDAKTGLAIPTEQFRLSLIRIDDASIEFKGEGPEIVVVLEGQFTVTEFGEGGDAAPIDLRLGQAVFIGAITERYRVVGRGRLGRVVRGTAEPVKSVETTAAPGVVGFEG